MFSSTKKRRVKSPNVSLSPGTEIFFRYDDCCASSRLNSGILAEFEKKSTFGNLVKLNLNATPDRKLRFPTCLKNGELVISF